VGYDNRGLYIRGYLGESSSRGLYLSGYGIGTPERTLHIAGVDLGASERGVYLTGKDADTSERDLYVTGSSSGNSERSLYLTGSLSSSSERALYLETKGVGSSEAYDAVIATIVVASDATSVTKTMVKSTTWREGTSGEWESTDCTLTAGKTYQFRTPNSGSGSGTTAVLPNIKASVTVDWDTSGSTITTVGDYFLYSYADSCSGLTSLSVPDTSGLTTVGSSFMVSYAQNCSSLTSLSVPDTSGLTTVGDYFMVSYAYNCSNLTSLSVPDTSGLTTVGSSFMSYYAYGCSSLTSLILKGDTGWFSSHNISWNVPSSRLNYLYGYCEPAYLTNWQGLTTSGKTLYTNYIQSPSYVKALVIPTPVIGEKYPLPPFRRSV
jgi:hypothetical protein